METKHSTEPLWTWVELCDALGLERSEGPDVTGLCFDSRLVQPRELFIALPGDPGPRFNVAQRSERDGHDFIEQALEQGASGALVDREVSSEGCFLRVENTIDGLWELARYRRSQLDCPVVSVTGSSGKTTLTTFLAKALDAFAPQGSFNNYIGLPLSVASTPKSATCAVYEIGTNHEGEIAPLSRLARPTVAVVLNVLPVHIGHFPSFESLMVEKLSIADGLEGGGIFVCSEELSKNRLVPDVAFINTFGSDPAASVAFDQIAGNSYEFTSKSETVRVEVPGGGRHRAETLAATGAVLVALDRPLEHLNRVGETLPTGRGNVHRQGGVLVIDESYNANPTSMRAAIEQFLQRDLDGRRIAVLGQMNELGEREVEYHSELADLANSTDAVICVGELMKHLYSRLDEGTQKRFYKAVNDDLMDYLLSAVEEGDGVLIKGSHSFFWEANFVERFVEKLRAGEH